MRIKPFLFTRRQVSCGGAFNIIMRLQNSRGSKDSIIIASKVCLVDVHIQHSEGHASFTYFRASITIDTFYLKEKAVFIVEVGSILQSLFMFSGNPFPF